MPALNSILHSLRSHENREQRDVANELSISLDKYQALESGIENIDAELAQKLSNLYHVPPQLFITNDPSHISVVYSHNTFTNSNGYVNHLYHDSDSVIAVVTAVKDELIQFLKDEVQRLRKQNEQLLESLLNKK